jgi:O-antigen/teichoic acid export membrane protein
MTESSDLRTNMTLSLLITFISGLATTIYPIFIGMLYSSTLMGQFAILYSWVTFLSIPIANGIAPAIMRFIAVSSDESAGGLEELGFQISVIYFLSVFICLIPLNIVVFHFNLAQIFFMLILLFMVKTHFIFKKSLQGREFFQELFRIEVISFILFIFGTILFLFVLPIDDGPLGWYLLIPMIIYHLAFNSIYIIPKVRMLEFNILELKIFNYDWESILKYSAFIGFGSLLGLGLSQIQIILSDLYFSDYEVGVLGFWKYVVAALGFIPVAILSLLIVRISNLRKVKSELAFEFVNSINWSISMIVVPLFGLIVLLSSFYPSLIDILTFSKYQMSIYWPIFVFLLFQAIGSILNTPTLSYTHSSQKYVRIDTFSTIIYSTITVISWIIFVPLFQIFGFALGIAVGSLSNQIVLQISVMKITNKAIGSQLYFLLPMYLILGFILVFMREIFPIITIILWCLFSFPISMIGINKLHNLIGEKAFAIKESEN